MLTYVSPFSIVNHISRHRRQPLSKVSQPVRRKSDVLFISKCFHKSDLKVKSPMRLLTSWRNKFRLQIPERNLSSSWRLSRGFGILCLFTGDIAREDEEEKKREEEEDK